MVLTTEIVLIITEVICLIIICDHQAAAWR